MSEIRMLRTFLAIEKHGTMAAAADRMALTHAAVGAQMRTLERVCQRQLFDRSGRSIQLNDAGRSIIEQARMVVAAYDSLLRGVADARSFEGSITIGSTVSSMGFLAANVIRLKVSYPGLNVRLIHGSTPDLERQVRAGEIDAAVIISEPRATTSPELWERLYDEPLVLLANPAIAPADAPVTSLLKRFPFIGFEAASLTGAHVTQPAAPVARGGQPGAGNELDCCNCRPGAAKRWAIDCAAPAACRVGRRPAVVCEADSRHHVGADISAGTRLAGSRWRPRSSRISCCLRWRSRFGRLRNAGGVRCGRRPSSRLVLQRAGRIRFSVRGSLALQLREVAHSARVVGGGRQRSVGLHRLRHHAFTIDWHPGLVAASLHSFATARQFLVRHRKVHLAIRNVDLDHITLFHQTDRAAFGCFRGSMPDHQP